MTKSQQAYPTDLNDTEWARIAPYRPKPSSTGAPRQHDWRTLLNAIFLYCQERLCLACLASRFSCVENGLPLLSAISKDWLVGANQHSHPGSSSRKRRQATAMIADSQSVKSAEGGEKRGFDGGKLVSGRKRNLLVDTLGLVVLAKVTAANVQDVHAGKQWSTSAWSAHST